MEIFFNIVTLLAVAGLALVLLIIHKVRKFLRKGKKILEGMARPRPERINLKRVGPPDRAKLRPKSGDARQQIDQVRQLGFEDLGSFGVTEFRDVHLHGLIHRKEQMVAIVYEQQDVGAWTEVRRRFQNGRINRVLTESGPFQVIAPISPLASTHGQPGMSLQEAIHTVKRGESGGALATPPDNADEFRRRFEQDWERESQQNAQAHEPGAYSSSGVGGVRVFSASFGQKGEYAQSLRIGRSETERDDQTSQHSGMKSAQVTGVRTVDQDEPAKEIDFEIESDEKPRENNGER